MIYIRTLLLLKFLLISASAHASLSRFLFIGDSHSVGTFGVHLDGQLRTLPGVQIASFASCGSVGKWWLNGQATACGYRERLPEAVRSVSARKHVTPSLRKLIQKFKPDALIVALGSNYATMTDIEIAVDVNRVLDTWFSNGEAPTPQPCFWIGPPASRRFGYRIDEVHLQIETVMKDRVKKQLQACALFNSADAQVTQYPSGGDGLHYDGSEEGRDIAKNWANEAFSFVLSEMGLR